ncbi:DUF5683 domain-containing protein [Chitinophaga arvensicola]|uniref:DUF5683 domain-containing protein n=1 Tax=Chitinophaga arvensicola TaxID=29529 RepID=UPI000B7CE731|nr:DUF5683 domain-containing protein [Chitinophaga arvensicola]
MFLTAAAVAIPAHAQQDTLRPVAKTMDTIIRPTPAPGTDTVKAANSALFTDSAYVPDSKLPHSPRKAALYSAVVPGLGQAYNKEYWKIPLAYAAIGTCTYFFIDNMKTYKMYRDAYRLRVDGNPDTKDTNPKTAPFDDEAIKGARDQFRQYVDYSVLFFVLAYGINIIDATVFAHLRNFDMSDDLSMRVSPTIINNRTLGLSLNISIGGKKAKSNRYFAGR